MLRKNENFTTDVVMTGTGSLIKAGSIEYQMPRKYANEILSTRRGQEKNMRPQDFLVKYVNDECGLLRACTKVIII